jgi:outer membrane protein
MSLTSGSTCIAEFCIMQVLISTDIWEVCSVLSDMKIFRVALLCSLVVSFSSASADQRFALVKIRKIYVELPSTALLEIEIGQDRNNIIKDQRAEQLREMLAELQVLRGELTDTSKPLNDEMNRKLARNYEIKRMEAQNIKQEFETFRADQEKKINRKMVNAMKVSLARILDASQVMAKEKGFDYVLDSSGATNTGIGFILYSKDAPDFTEDVKARLLLTEPPMPEKKPAPDASTAPTGEIAEPTARKK